MPVSVPYPGPGRYGGLDYLAGEGGGFVRGARFGLTAMFRQALVAGELEGLDMLADFSRAMDQTTRSSRNQLTTLHHQVGQAMQNAVLEAYDLARATKGRMTGPYRLSTRSAGGKMRGALAHAEFFRGTYDGIAFANVSLMDRMARQWHRLNFGAQPDAGPRSRTFAVRWQGLAVATVGYHEGPSRPFLMPRGFWQGAYGRAAFGPTGATPLYRTAGISAWNFLDAGTEVLSRTIGPAYEGLYGRWFASAQRGVGPLSRVRTVHGGIAAPRQ